MVQYEERQQRLFSIDECKEIWDHQYAITVIGKGG